MQVRLPYGTRELTLSLPEERTDVLLPVPAPARPDARRAFMEAVEHPAGAAPLRELAARANRVCLVISDRTRPTPNHLLVPWLLEVLGAAGRSEVTVLVGTGSHEPHTPAQCAALTGGVPAGCRLQSHDAGDGRALVLVGHTPALGPVYLNRAWAEADLRIATGFIEPHFFAGFSGGGKAVVPGVAGLDTILRLHRAGLIADPASTWLRLDENPTQEAIRAAVRLLPPHFLVNVTLDPAGAITGVFAGDWELAHRLGTDFCGRHSTFPVVGHYRLALTTNGGHPLDQNLYQTVKGMSAAARLLAPGGTLVIASACTAGVPDFGGFGAMLGRHPRPEHFLAGLDLTAPAAHDQWEAQALAQLLVQHRIELYSSLPTERVRRAWLEPVADLSRRMTELLDANAQERLALMPRGPLAVPVPADAPPTA